MIEKFVPKELNITENAILKVKNLIAEENNKNLNLRVFVTGGGCSGFQYGFKLDDNAAVSYTHLTLPTILLV